MFKNNKVKINDIKINDIVFYNILEQRGIVTKIDKNGAWVNFGNLNVFCFWNELKKINM